ncbi:MAG: GAF domain-containing protein [Nannocystaceae bacterium]
MSRVVQATPKDDASLAKRLLEGQAEVLARIHRDEDLHAILGRLCEIIEAQSPGLLTSILLVDAARRHLVHGAAPSLPADYCEAVDGITISEGVGSCGHAAATGARTVVDDIATHPNWTAFRGLAYETHGLRACWSTPIKSWDGKVVATFAMYRREPGTPSARDRKLADYCAHLVAIAVEREQERARLRSRPG